MPEERRGPIAAEGGTGHSIGVPPQPPPPPPSPATIWQIVALVAAVAGVIAGLLGYDGVLLIFCGLSAVLNLVSLILRRLEGGTGGSIGVPPKPSPPPT